MCRRENGGIVDWDPWNEGRGVCAHCTESVVDKHRGRVVDLGYRRSISLGWVVDFGHRRSFSL